MHKHIYKNGDSKCVRTAICKRGGKQYIPEGFMSHPIHP